MSKTDIYTAIRGYAAHQAWLAEKGHVHGDTRGADPKRLVHEGDMSLGNATVNGDMYLWDATVEGNVYLEGATVKGDVYLEGATVKGGVYLEGATVEGNVYLWGATVNGDMYLWGATVKGGVYADGVPAIQNLDAKILARLEQGGNLDMGNWHTCKTTHCRGEWAITLAGEAGAELERRFGVECAAALIYTAAGQPIPDFYAREEDALDDMRKRAGVEL